MDHATQVSLADEILGHLDAGTTCYAADIYRNRVETYTCGRQLEREHATLFRRYPLVMGLECRLPEPGSYLTENQVGVPILMTRTEHGEVKAFLNVCRHRGAQVARDCGRSKSKLICPYHGWTYDLEGNLVGIPDRRSFEGVELAAHGLVELPAAERHGLLWVGPAPDRSPKSAAQFEAGIDNHLQGLGEELSSFDFGTYHHYETRTLRRRMNWKMVIDTFLESYHFPVLHTSTVAPIFIPNLCLFHPFGLNLREMLPRRTIAELRERPREAWDLVSHTAIIYVLFPNTVLVMQADHAELWRIFPADGRVDESIMFLEFYIPEPVTSESARRHWDRNMDLTLRTVEEEDFPTGEGIQSGLTSGAQAHVTYGRNEPALQHWHWSVSEALGCA